MCYLSYRNSFREVCRRTDGRTARVRIAGGAGITDKTVEHKSNASNATTALSMAVGRFVCIPLLFSELRRFVGLYLVHSGAAAGRM